MGFKQVFDKKPLFLDISNVKEILRMIARMKLLQKSYLPIWFALISMRGMTLDKLPLPRSSSFLHFALQVILGSLVSAIAYFLSLKARNSVNFQPICKIPVSEIIS